MIFGESIFGASIFPPSLFGGSGGSAVANGGTIFGGRYFGPRYFGARYFGTGTPEEDVPEAPTLLNTLVFRPVYHWFDPGYSPVRYRLRTLNATLGAEDTGEYQTDYIVLADAAENLWRFGPVPASFLGELLAEDVTNLEVVVPVYPLAASSGFGVGYVSSEGTITRLSIPVVGLTLRSAEHIYEGRHLVFRSGSNGGLRRPIRIHNYDSPIHTFEFTPTDRLPYLPAFGDWVEVV